ncbi:hypothetical protein PENSTE_c011G07970 [Penicillium steckii]|uniref:Mitochondrial division protein 1 n=1 Tax=Penicillium steckii TaxID=303698 RepID=A0A1V6T7I8_9EURO|nr:hypothetical protein PENSTE_c011G07970 [Penicillium steckii]
MATSTFHGENYGAQIGNNYGTITAEFRTYDTADSDRICVQALGCPDTLAVKNSLKQAKDKLLRQSFEWVLQNPSYLSWRDGNDVCLLWIKGGAGKGKTMMSIGLIERLCQEQIAGRSAVVTYFFCQNDNNELNTIASVIKGLIFRLIDQRDEAKECLRRRWDTKNNRFTEDVNSWRALWGVFLEMLDRCDCSKVYIIVDALDECRDDERDMDEFLKSIVRNGADRPSKMKWILTSRPLDTAERHLVAGHERMQVSLELNSEAVSNAVRYYISYRVEELSLLQRYGENLKRDIETGLTEKAQGTFLWVSLVCKKLENVCRDEVLSTIESLPQGLPAFYDKIFKQLTTGEPDIVRSCIRLLKVMILVYRPLVLEEVSSVTGLTDEKNFIQALVHRCASFINLQGKSIHFVHQSARDYLVGEKGKPALNFHEQFGHNEIVENCLSQLSTRLKVNLMEEPRLDSDRNFLLQSTNEKGQATLISLSYVSIFWVAHIQRGLWLAYHGETEECMTEQHAFPDGGPVITFLHTRLLEWLEYLSLAGRLQVGMGALESLKITAKVVSQNPCRSSLLTIRAKNYPSMLKIVEEALRFLRRHFDTIVTWPLQIYSSAIIFSPESSLVRKANIDKVPPWLTKLGNVEHEWEALIQARNPHLKKTRTVAFSPDGQYLATGSDDCTIRLWDSTNGWFYRSLTVDSVQIKTLAFSPDSKKIVFGTAYDSLYKKIRFRDATAADIQKSFVGHMGPVKNHLWPHGKQIVFKSCDRNVHILDITTGEIERTLSGHSGTVNTVAFSPDGRHIVSGSFDRTIKIWDATTGELEKTLIGHSRPVNSIAFSPNGKQIVSGSFETTIKLWNAATGELQMTLGGRLSRVTSVAFSPNGKQIVSGSSHKKVKLWNAITGELEKTLIGHLGPVTSVAFSPDGKNVASGSHDGMIFLWDTTTGEIQKTLAYCTDSVGSVHPFLNLHKVWALAFSPDGTQIASCCGNNENHFWDATTTDAQTIPSRHASPIIFVAFSPSGNEIASASVEGGFCFKIWDVATGGLRKSWMGGRALLKSPSYALLAWIRFCFDPRPILKQKEGFSVEGLWMHYEGRRILRIPLEWQVVCLDVLGDQLAFGFRNGRVCSIGFDRSRLQSLLTGRSEEKNSCT